MFKFKTSRFDKLHIKDKIENEVAELVEEIENSGYSTFILLVIVFAICQTGFSIAIIGVFITRKC